LGGLPHSSVTHDLHLEGSSLEDTAEEVDEAVQDRQDWFVRQEWTYGLLDQFRRSAPDPTLPD
jgi:hypothetical protein